jgi:hypothetical protein
VNRPRRLLTVALAAAVFASSYAAYLQWELLVYTRRHPPGIEFQDGRCEDRGLVAHWTFDQLDGLRIRDSSGIANDGAIEFYFLPLAKYWLPRPSIAEGKVGSALDFQKLQWMSGGNSACYTSNQLSLMAWVWLESPAKTPTIAAKSAWAVFKKSSAVDGWWLMTTSRPQIMDKDERLLELGIAWGSGMTHVESGYQLPLKEWHHIAVIMDNDRHEVQFYVDGLPFGPTHTGVHAWNTNYSNSFFVADYDGSGRWPWFGKIDDVLVYNRVVTPEEVAAAYRRAGT